MKRNLIAIALLAASGAANAGLSFSELSTVTRTEAFNVANLPGYATGTTLKIGTLRSDEGGTVTFTYLGQESGFDNRFFLSYAPVQHLYESDPVGSAISGPAGRDSPVGFSFEGSSGQFAFNGGSWAANTSIGLIGTNMTIGSGRAAGSYAFVLGYNDSAGAARLGDWDDFVVGVNFVTTAIPEPGTYAMLLAGLGLLGWAARRRGRKAA